MYSPMKPWSLLVLNGVILGLATAETLGCRSIVRNPPKFEDYPVSEFYKGKPANPKNPQSWKEESQSASALAGGATNAPDPPTWGAAVRLEVQ